MCPSRQHGFNTLSERRDFAQGNSRTNGIHSTNRANFSVPKPRYSQQNQSHNSAFGSASSALSGPWYRHKTRPPISNEEKIKSEMCRNLLESGACPYGVGCRFAHHESELKIIIRHPKHKTQLCKDYHGSEGMCMFGARCSYIHQTERKFPEPLASDLSEDIASANATKYTLEGLGEQPIRALWQDTLRKLKFNEEDIIFVQSLTWPELRLFRSTLVDLESTATVPSAVLNRATLLQSTTDTNVVTHYESSSFSTFSVGLQSNPSVLVDEVRTLGDLLVEDLDASHSNEHQHRLLSPGKVDSTAGRTVVSIQRIHDSGGGNEENLHALTTPRRSAPKTANRKSLALLPSPNVVRGA